MRVQHVTHTLIQSSGSHDNVKPALCLNEIWKFTLTKVLDFLLGFLSRGVRRDNVIFAYAKISITISAI